MAEGKSRTGAAIGGGGTRTALGQAGLGYRHRRKCGVGCPGMSSPIQCTAGAVCTTPPRWALLHTPLPPFLSHSRLQGPSAQAAPLPHTRAYAYLPIVSFGELLQRGGEVLSWLMTTHQKSSYLGPLAQIIVYPCLWYTAATIFPIKCRAVSLQGQSL